MLDYRLYRLMFTGKCCYRINMKVWVWNEPLGFPVGHQRVIIYITHSRRPGWNRTVSKDFKSDVDRIPFHITTVFEDKQDSLWAPEQFLNSVCDQHAPHIVLKPIGPLKRDDESLAVDVKEKANLSNCFFATVGAKLADIIKPHHQILTTTRCTSIIQWSREETYFFEEKQIHWPWGYFATVTWSCWTSIAVPLTNLYLRSLRETKVYDD